MSFRKLGQEAGCLLREGHEYLEDCNSNFEYHAAVYLFMQLIYICSIYLFIVYFTAQLLSQ